NRFQSARDLGFALRMITRPKVTPPPPAKKPAAPRKHSTRRTKKTVDSVEVLPLFNASAADAGAEYLADGVTESMSGTLPGLPKVGVMARSTVFRYKGKDIDPQAVGAELGVRAVLTGRLVRRGDQVMLKLELVDTGDGAQLWGGSYGRKLDDLLA